MRDPLSALGDARLAWLLRRSQRGDREAFRSLYRALYGPVSGYVGRRVSTRAEAEDVVAQVFLQLLTALAKVDPRKGTVSAYVLGSARNLLIDRARAARPGAGLEAIAPEPAAPLDPQQALEAEEERAALRARVAGLLPEVQELLRLRYEEGLRYAEIAQIVGVGEVAVRQRLSRVIRELRGGWGRVAVKGTVGG